MDDARLGLVKWIAALIVMGGVVAYAIPGALEAFQTSVRFGDDATAANPADGAAEAEAEVPPAEEAPPPAPPPPPPAGPVADGNSVPNEDLSIAGGQVVGIDDDELRIGGDQGDAIVVSFPLIEGDPRCVEAARLEIEVTSATPTELGAYPSGLFNLAALEEGTPPPAPPVLDQAPQSLAFTDGSTGRLQWDVTGLYRRWALGEPFQGDQRAPADAPFIVTVRPTDPTADPERELVFDAVEAGSSAPTLSWIGADGCGA